MNDAHLYAKVLEELRSAPPIPGLWAKAYAEADGIDSKARALYLRWRVKQLEQDQIESDRIHQEIAMTRVSATIEAERVAQRKRDRAAGVVPLGWVLVSVPIFIGLIYVFSYVFSTAI